MTEKDAKTFEEYKQQLIEDGELDEYGRYPYRNAVRAYYQES